MSVSKISTTIRYIAILLPIFILTGVLFYDDISVTKKVTSAAHVVVAKESFISEKELTFKEGLMAKEKVVSEEVDSMERETKLESKKPEVKMMTNSEAAKTKTTTKSESTTPTTKSEPTTPTTKSEPETISKTKATTANANKYDVNANMSNKYHTLAEFRTRGYYEDTSGYSFTYYSQKRLPGKGLRIPGRHVNIEGYVCDGDGNICLASDDFAKGTIIQIPFGNGIGVVYDSGSGEGNLDIYID